MWHCFPHQEKKERDTGGKERMRWRKSWWLRENESQHLTYICLSVCLSSSVDAVCNRTEGKSVWSFCFIEKKLVILLFISHIKRWRWWKISTKSGVQIKIKWSHNMLPSCCYCFYLLYRTEKSLSSVPPIFFSLFYKLTRSQNFNHQQWSLFIAPSKQPSNIFLKCGLSLKWPCIYLIVPIIYPCVPDGLDNQV